MIKRNVKIRLWSTIYDVTVITSRTTEHCYCQLLNTFTTTLFMRFRDWFRSKLCTITRTTSLKDKTIRNVSMFLLLESASHFFEISEINSSIAYRTRKNRKLEVTTKRLNRERIDLTIKSCSRSKISRIRDSKRSFLTNSRIFSKSSM